MNRRTLHIKRLPVLAVLLALAAQAGAVTYTAYLNGQQAVPPTESRATGDATFRPDKEMGRVKFRLTVKNLYDAVEAHLYKGDAGDPAWPERIVATLYAGPPIQGRTNGTLAAGEIRAEDLKGELEGHMIDELIHLLETDRLFVNVATAPHPEGEIRGQVNN